MSSSSSSIPSLHESNEAVSARPQVLNKSIQKSPLSKSILPKVNSKPVSKPLLESDPDTIELEYNNLESDPFSENQSSEKTPIQNNYGNYLENRMKISGTDPSKKQAEELWRAIQEMATDKKILNQENYDATPDQNAEYNEEENIVTSSVEISDSSKNAESPKNINGIKPYADSKIVQMDFEDRIHHFVNKKKENNVTVAMEMLAGEQAQCTFTPQVNSNSRRNLQEFLSSQEKFMEKRALKVKNYQIWKNEKEISELQRSPKINPNSAKIAKNKPRPISVHKEHRLEGDSLRGTPSKTPRKKLNRTFDLARSVPKKTINQQNEEIRVKKEQKEKQKTQKEHRNKEASFIQRKINRELDELFKKYNSKNAQLTPTIVCDILKEFGMINDIKEEKLGTDLYAILFNLQKGTKNGIDQNLLKSAVFQILRIPNTPQIQGLPKDLHTKFTSFYYNKLSHQKAQNYKPEFTYKPQINKVSSKLAEKGRENMLIKASKQVPINNLKTKKDKPTLSEMQTIIKSAYEKQIEEQKKKKIKDETKGCTFQPNADFRRPEKNNKNKCISLYNLSKSTKKQVGKTTEQVEYEKSKHELTFTPRLGRFNESTTSLNKSGYVNKGVDTSVERIRKARYVFFQILTNK